MYRRNRVGQLRRSIVRTIFAHPLRALRHLRAPRPRRISVATPRGIRPAGHTRKTWTNHVGNQVAQPLQFFTPTTLLDLQQIVLEAKRMHRHVRAAGSGHSFSDVAVTTDFLIDPHGLDRVLSLDTTVLRSGYDADGAHFVHVENGIRLRKLNAALDGMGLGLLNMGSYDAQTIIGAISTSTHGSGTTLGPLPDVVASIDIIDEDGRLKRVEPLGGITDPVKFSRVYPDRALVQDDGVFDSCVVAMGCIGIVYSVVLRVTERYFLSETRRRSTWSSVRSEISIGGRLLTDNRHVDIDLNPHPIRGEFTCIVGTRNIVPTSSKVTSRGILYNIIPNLPWISEIFGWLFNTFYDLTPEILDSCLSALLERPFTNVSYKVLNLGAANNISAYSNEIAFPMEDDRHIAGIEAILEVIKECREEGDLYVTVPLGIRFVHESRHYLSMMHGRSTCTVEVPCVTGTHGGMEIMRRVEERVCNETFDGRPHWGQVHTANRQTVERLFPRTFAAWLANYRVMNSTGMFSNAFTNRLTLD